MKITGLKDETRPPTLAASRKAPSLPDHDSDLLTIRKNRLTSLWMLLALLLAFYSGSYVFLRLTHYITRGANLEYTDTMYAKSAIINRGGAAYFDGKIQSLGSTRKPPYSLPVYVLHFYSPLIKAECIVNKVYP